jgi:pilus assembly protein Flp/PilA
MNKIAQYISTFAKDEDGAALSEYLVLLGILVAGVIAAVTAFGGALATAFNDWGTWATTALDAP